MPNLIIRISLSIVAVGLITIRIIWPQIMFDTVSLGLLTILILIWMLPLLKTAELPGGIKIEFREIVTATKDIIGSGSIPVSKASASAIEVNQLEYEQNPNLLFIAYRLEIGNRLHKIAKDLRISEEDTLDSIISEIVEKRLISKKEERGLKRLINLGNAAAHGAVLHNTTKESLRIYSETIINFLEERFRKTSGEG